jgi:dGTPase
MADIVAYVNHDIGDAIRASIITENDLPATAIDVLGHSHRERVNAMVCDIIERSWAVRSAGKIATPAITMSPPVIEATDTLRQFLFERVYNLQSAQKETDRARGIVRRLYHYFNKHADKLPLEYALYSDEMERRVVDYIAGMTDQYATRIARELSLSRDKTKTV